jgi:rubrerythrin
MLDEARSLDRRDEEYVEFFRAGAALPGEYRCVGCGYGVTVQERLPSCPMCAGTSWERGTWVPFARRSTVR